MPWYMNRLANKMFTKYSSPELVRRTLDIAQEILWAKVNNYYAKRGVQC